MVVGVSAILGAFAVGLGAVVSIRRLHGRRVEQLGYDQGPHTSSQFSSGRDSTASSRWSFGEMKRLKELYNFSRSPEIMIEAFPNRSKRSLGGKIMGIEARRHYRDADAAERNLVNEVSIVDCTPIVGSEFYTQNGQISSWVPPCETTGQVCKAEENIPVAMTGSFVDVSQFIIKENHY